MQWLLLVSSNLTVALLTSSLKLCLILCCCLRRIPPPRRSMYHRHPSTTTTVHARALLHSDARLFWPCHLNSSRSTYFLSSSKPHCHTTFALFPIFANLHIPESPRTGLYTPLLVCFSFLMQRIPRAPRPVSPRPGYLAVVAPHRTPPLTAGS